MRLANGNWLVSQSSSVLGSLGGLTPAEERAQRFEREAYYRQQVGAEKLSKESFERWRGDGTAVGPTYYETTDLAPDLLEAQKSLWKKRVSAAIAKVNYADYSHELAFKAGVRKDPVPPPDTVLKRAEAIARDKLYAELDHYVEERKKAGDSTGGWRASREEGIRLGGGVAAGDGTQTTTKTARTGTSVMAAEPVVFRPEGEPQETWESVVGMDAAKAALRGAVIEPLENPGLYTVASIRERARAAMLFGPAGTGKTTLVRALVNEASRRSRARGGKPYALFSVSPSSIKSSVQAMSAARVVALFEAARRASPAIIFFDEIDKLMPGNDARPSEANLDVISQFLTGVEARAPGQVLFVIGATNHPGNLEPSVRTRLGRAVYVPLPSYTVRREMVRRFLAKHGQEALMADAAGVHGFLHATCRWSGRELRDLFAAVDTVRIERTKMAKRKEGGLTDRDLVPFTWDMFVGVAARQRPATSIAELREYMERAEIQPGDPQYEPTLTEEEWYASGGQGPPQPPRPRPIEVQQRDPWGASVVESDVADDA